MKSTRFLALLAGLIPVVSTAFAAGSFTFSGVPGSTPLTITLNDTIFYTVTTPATFAPGFVIQGPGNVNLSYTKTESSTMFCSINSAPAVEVTTFGNGFSVGDILSTDMVLMPEASQLGPLQVGDVVQLNPGTITFYGPPETYDFTPVSGLYETFIVDLATGNRIDAPIPEPSGCAAVLGIASLVFVMSRRRCTRIRALSTA